MQVKEIRSIRGVPFEVRAMDDSNGDLRLEGYAAVFDNEIDLGWFREVIRKGAFTKTLKESDVVALADHDTGKTLARKSSGTLDIAEDDHGLRVGLSLDPGISRHVDEYRTVKRGDKKGMSFGFNVIKEAWNSESELRELLEVRLFEVSLVAFPAYEATEIEARAILDCKPKQVTPTDHSNNEPVNGADDSASNEPDENHSIDEYEIEVLRLRLKLEEEETL